MVSMQAAVGGDAQRRGRGPIIGEWRTVCSRHERELTLLSSFDVQMEVALTRTQFTDTDISSEPNPPDYITLQW